MKVEALCALAASLGAAFLAAHAAAASSGGVVWVQTNELTGNSVVVYDRGADGRLTRAGTYPTGGNGGVAAPGTESDHLASQASLVYDAADGLLFAVNAGSDSVSAFSVDGDSLQLESVVP